MHIVDKYMKTGILQQWKGINGLGNGLWRVRHQITDRTDDELYSYKQFGTNFNILIWIFQNICSRTYISKRHLQSGCHFTQAAMC